MQATSKLSKGRRAFLVALPFTFLSVVAQTDHPLPTDPPTSKDQLIPVAQRKYAHDFKLIDSDGKNFALDKLKGKVVIINFWATWCGGCKFELPYFVDYDQKYRDQGLVTVGVSMDEGGFATVKPFWTQHKMTYPTVIGNDALANQLGLTGMPFTLLIDQQGRIAIAHSGVLDRADFDHHVQQLLQAKK